MPRPRLLFAACQPPSAPSLRHRRQPSDRRRSASYQHKFICMTKMQPLGAAERIHPMLSRQITLPAAAKAHLRKQDKRRCIDHASTCTNPPTTFDRNRSPVQPRAGLFVLFMFLQIGDRHFRGLQACPRQACQANCTPYLQHHTYVLTSHHLKVTETPAKLQRSHSQSALLPPAAASASIAETPRVRVGPPQQLVSQVPLAMLRAPSLDLPSPDSATQQPRERRGSAKRKVDL